MKDLNKYLAKDTGESILKHTDNVISNIKRLTAKYKIDKKNTDILILSAILHDIGKLRSKTQNYFKKGLEDNNKYKFAHNIIGWYFTQKYLNHKDKDKVANLVLWHHANHNSCEDLNTKIFQIEKEITEKEIELMKGLCIHYNVEINDEGDDYFESNTRFDKLDNLYRAILITSDVCASSGEDVNTIFDKSPMGLSMLDPSFLNSNRTKKQLDIIDMIEDESTNLIKAPTGFGKSIIGLLWAMIRNKQVIWVCPTNVISQSIYDDIIDNLKLLGLDISIELYLTGERKKANNDLLDFTSDIVITNIDNFIKPDFTNSYGARCLMIYDCDVIFDEVHEYENMNTALFAAYNNIMDKRHNQLDSTTVMLTATEPTFRFYMVGGKPINILPNKNEHFKAAHDDDYKLFIHDDIPEHLMEGEFVSFYHTVNDVQDQYINYNGTKLISHGRYLDNDKEYRKQLVLDNYRKNGKRKPIGVFTNQILTTSCDYSVKKIFIKAPSVKVFQQSIGRLNRWGGMGLCEIHISTNKTRADSMVIGGELENKYQELFIKALTDEFGGKVFKLDEMYRFLNIFNEKHSKLRNDISYTNLLTSKKMLSHVYPKKFKGKSETKIANANKLRRSTSTDEMFINVKRRNSDDLVTISFNIGNLFGTTWTFNEDKGTYGKQLKLIKTFEGYNKFKNITPEVLREEAIFYDRPYPVFNYVYDEELGLLKIN